MQYAVREARPIRRAWLLLLATAASAAGSAQAAREMTHLTVSASVPTACEVRVDGSGAHAPVEMRCTREAFAAVTMTSSGEGALGSLDAEPSRAMVHLLSGIRSDKCVFIVLGRGLEARAQLLSRSCLRDYTPAAARFALVTADFLF